MNKTDMIIEDSIAEKLCQSGGFMIELILQSIDTITAMRRIFI